MRGELIQFVVQHALRVAPALIGPEEVHEDALNQDAQQQRAAQHPEEAQRQPAQPGDQPLLALLLALCPDGRHAHASTPSAAPRGPNSANRSSDSALSSRTRMPWFSPPSPASPEC